MTSALLLLCPRGGKRSDWVGGRGGGSLVGRCGWVVISVGRCTVQASDDEHLIKLWIGLYAVKFLFYFKLLFLKQ